MTGSSVAEACQVLLRASVVINVVPFVYTFLVLMTLDTARTFERVAGAVGAVVTAAGMVTAFLPTDDVMPRRRASRRPCCGTRQATNQMT